MNQITTKAIILSRTDFGEADRILTLLTPDHGKLRLMAKGVRKVKSKLAGGIELFSVSDIVFIRGRGDIGTLVSTRLIHHYGSVVNDVNRTMLGYDLIKMLARVTEDEAEDDYFVLLEQTFAALDDTTIDLQLIRAWFVMQLLRIGGHAPNLHTDPAGNKLTADKRYEFSYDDMAFSVRPEGHFTADHIKFLRVGFSGNQPHVLQKIAGYKNLLDVVTPLIQTAGQTYLRT
jgi:DNA repair protein RecO (recombination protein O)